MDKDKREQGLKRRLSVFWKAFFEGPIRALRYLPALLNRGLSEESYVLKVCGPNAIKDISEACQSAGARPFLIFGTLRGYVLLNGFLSNSGDIDIGLMDQDYQKRHLIKEALLKKGYKHHIDNDCEMLLDHPKFPSLMIDFFCVYEKDHHMYITTGTTEDYKVLTSNSFPPEVFDKFSTVNFCNIKISVPLKTEDFLLAHYGEQWKDPSKKYHYFRDHKNLRLDDPETVTKKYWE